MSGLLREAYQGRGSQIVICSVWQERGAQKLSANGPGSSIVETRFKKAGEALPVASCTYCAESAPREMSHEL
jgi:hypothetical protein